MKGIIIKLPNYKPLLPSKSRNTLDVIRSIFIYGNTEGKLFQVLAFEAFLSFVFSFVTFTYVNSKKLDSDIPSEGVSELKRFLSGNLNYISRINSGENATLSFGVTALISGFSRESRIFLLWGSANMIGFIAAYFIFIIQSRNSSLLDLIFSFFGSFFNRKKKTQSEEEEVEGVRGKAASRKKKQ